MAALQRLRAWLARKLEVTMTEMRTIHGMPVEVLNTRPDIDTEQVCERLDRVLALIERCVPWRYRHLRRDIAVFWVRRYPCRGAFYPEERACVTELTFLANPSFSDSQIAASIVHEAMHARIRAAGCVIDSPEKHAREERLCRRAELEFGLLAPDGEPVVRRALDSLSLEDSGVAPEIDWELARRRVAEVDAASGVGRQASGERRQDGAPS